MLMVAHVARPLECPRPETCPFRPRPLLFPLVVPIRDGHASGHHLSVEIDAAAPADDEQPVILVPFGAAASGIPASHQTLQCLFCLPAAGPAPSAALADLVELRRIDAFSRMRSAPIVRLSPSAA
ncbi:hypothetical protein AJ87_30460 [Rhizobium yanglingense]|nr:hypothetical protein AJ87_30460 [Rhizobium yanglingense]